MPWVKWIIKNAINDIYFKNTVRFEGSQIYPSTHVQSQGTAVTRFVPGGAPLIHLRRLAHWLGCNPAAHKRPRRQWPWDAGTKTGREALGYLKLGLWVGSVSCVICGQLLTTLWVPVWDNYWWCEPRHPETSPGSADTVPGFQRSSHVGNPRSWSAC